MSEAIVIGAGVGGMAAAIRLAVKGHSVTVFDPADAPGGKLSEFSSNGYRFDKGPSLFTMPHLVEELFTLADIPMDGRFAFTRLDEANRYFWEDGTRVSGWCDPPALAKELHLKLGVPETDTLKYLDRSHQMLATTGRTFLEHSLHRRETLLHGGVGTALGNARTSELFSSLHKLNTDLLRHPKAVQLFDRFATYNGSDPYRTPGLMRMISGLEHGQGAYFPTGGMYSIAIALHRLATDLGVQFRFNNRVERILLTPENDGVRGVLVSGDTYVAKIVVSNVDIVPTYRKLLPALPAPERVLRQERSSSALVFYWGVRRDHPELGLHNILFSNDYEVEFHNLFQRLQLYHDPTVYINITSKYAPGDAPPGCANWFTMINAPRDVGQDREAMVREARAAILSKIWRTLNIDLEPLIEVEHVLDPRGIAIATSSHQGSLYGTSSNSMFSAFLRHPNFHSRVQGLYFCGGSVHPGGGIPLALLSARIATDTIPHIARTSPVFA